MPCQTYSLFFMLQAISVTQRTNRWKKDIARSFFSGCSSGATIDVESHCDLRRVDALASMPFRNSDVDFSNGVFDGTVLVGVFAQARPTAHGLAQGARTGSLAS